MTRRFCSLLLVALCIPLTSFAQHIVVKEGTYTYYVPSSQSVDEAMNVALQRAQVQILADEFGTVISQTTSTRTVNSDMKSGVDFTSVGISDVRGEWIETIGEPEYEKYFGDNGMMVIKVTVKGKIRELKRAEVSFNARLLRDGITPSCESDSFREGNSMYVSFQTPSAGYLAIYLVCDSRAFCLFPYNSDEDGACEIRQNREYILFSPENSAPFRKDEVPELIITCNDDYETNTVYFIFSPNKFVKVTDSQKKDSSLQEDLILPRELPEEEFQKWLAKSRARDKEMQVDRSIISITR